MEKMDLVFIICSTTTVIISLTIFLIYLLRRKKNSIIDIKRKENDAYDYYLKTEIPIDIQRRYINNIRTYNSTNFEEADLDKLFFEIKRLRKDIQKANDIKYEKINEMIKDKDNGVFDYKEFIYRISTLTNISSLFELLNQNTDEKYQYVKNVLGDIVHTIRNPASGMRAIIAILKMENTNDELNSKIAALEQFIEEIDNNLNAYYEISHFSSYYSNENEVMSFKEEILSRISLIKISSGKNINYKYDICDINIDKSKSNILLLAVTCILENAIYYCKDNGIIEINTTLDNDTFEIEIYNDGTSIKEEILKHVFDYGFSTRGSSGRGLYIVKRAIEQSLNGVVICENAEDNSGVKFSIIVERILDNE